MIPIELRLWWHKSGPWRRRLMQHGRQLMDLRRWWCRLAHRGNRNIAYLGGPSYYCRRCQLSFRVPWAPQ